MWILRKLIFVFFFVFFHLLSRNLAIGIGKFIGRLVFYGGLRRKVVLKNLNFVFGEYKSEKEILDIAKSSYQFWVGVIFDVFFWYFHQKQMENKKIDFDKIYRINPEDSEIIKKINTEQKKSILLYGCHYGNIFSPIFLSLNWGDVYSITRFHKNKLVTKIDREIRGLFSNHPLSVSKSNTSEMFVAIKALKKKKILMLAFDQNDRDSPYFTNHFHRETSMPIGITRFIRADCSEIFFYFSRLNKNNVCEFHFKKISYDPQKKEEDLFQEIAGQYNRYLEEIILEQPEQYFWFHKRWKTDSKGETKFYDQL